MIASLKEDTQVLDWIHFMLCEREYCTAPLSGIVFVQCIPFSRRGVSSGVADLRERHRPDATIPGVPSVLKRAWYSSLDVCQ